MIGIRFYEELDDKNRKAETSQGTVVAVILEKSGRSWNLVWRIQNNKAITDCFAGVFDRPNSPVCTSRVARNYLMDSCRRIPEAKAREIHPQLFEYLEN